MNTKMKGVISLFSSCFNEPSYGSSPSIKWNITQIILFWFTNCTKTKCLCRLLTWYTSMAPSVGPWSLSTSKGGLESSAANGGTTTSIQRWRSLHGHRKRTESSTRPTNGLATAGQRSPSFFLEGNTVSCTHCMSSFPVWVTKQIIAKLIFSLTGRTTPSRTTGTLPWGGRWSMRGTCKMAARVSHLLTLEWKDATTDHVLQQSRSTVRAVPCL